MYRIFAAVLLLIFYGIYYGKLFIQKKEGITTNQLKNQVKSKTRIIAMLMGLATVMTAAGEVIAIVLGTSLLPQWGKVCGILIATVGDIVFFISVSTMGDSWRAGVNASEKTSLITSGIYSISRNPAFLGFDLVYIGILLMYFSWWLLGISLFAIVMLHLQVVLVEEPFLPQAFGEDYLRYREHVCRYLGRR